MATYIKTLKDENGDIVLPRTSKSAIQDIINEVPSGGTEGQVLTKAASGYDWTTLNVTDKVSKTGDIMTSYLTGTNGQVRNVHISTSDPTSSDGMDGDVWITYSEE